MEISSNNIHRSKLSLKNDPLKPRLLSLQLLKDPPEEFKDAFITIEEVNARKYTDPYDIKYSFPYSSYRLYEYLNRSDAIADIKLYGRYIKSIYDKYDITNYIISVHNVLINDKNSSKTYPIHLNYTSGLVKSFADGFRAKLEIIVDFNKDMVN